MASVRSISSKRQICYFPLWVALYALLSQAASLQRPLMAPVQAEKRPFSPSDMVKLHRIGSLQVSPSGNWGVFTRWQYNPETNKNSKSLWLMPLGKAEMSPSTLEPLPLTKAIDGVTDDEPVWIASNEILFLRRGLNKENPIAQLYSITFPEHAEHWTLEHEGLREREWFKLHPLPLSIQNLKYHSRGDFLTFTAEVYYQDKNLKATADREKKAKDEEFSTAMIFDKLYFRHWDEYDNHKNSHVFILHLGRARDPASDSINLLHGRSNLACPVPPHGDGSHYDISPDGKEIVFASMQDYNSTNQAYSTNTNIYTISTSGGEPDCISCENPGANTVPQYSPSGQYIAYLEMRTPKYEADKNRLIIYDHQTKKKRDLTESHDLSVDAFAWSAESEALFITTMQEGDVRLYRIDVATATLKLIVGEGTVNGLSRIPRSNNFVFSLNSLTSPNEFYFLDGSGLKVKRISGIHESYLSNVKMSAVEKFWFTGALNDQVMGYLLKPVDFDPLKKYPLAFLIHGGPQSGWTNGFSTRWNPQAFTGAGYAVIAINFHGSNGYGQAFTDSINRNWGSYPFEDLMKGLDYALEQYSFIDEHRIAGLGASYGGYMINWLNGHTDRFNCFVNHDGLFDLKSMYFTTEELYFPEYEFGGTPVEDPAIYQKYSPSNFVSNWETPTLVIHGGRDFRVAQGEGFSTFTALQRQGVTSKLIFFPDENHWVLKPANSLRWYREVLNWIQTFTKTA